MSHQKRLIGKAELLKQLSHHNKVFLEQGLSFDDPAVANISYGHVKQIDFTDVVIRAWHDVAQNTQEHVAGDDSAEFIQARHCLFEDVSFRGLTLRGSNFSYSEFKDCDFRETFDSVFELYGARLLRPKFSLDSRIYLIDFINQCEAIDEPEFYVGDKRIHGVSIDDMGRVVYAPSLKDRWQNVKQGLNADKAFREFDACAPAIGLVQQTLSKAVARLKH